MNPRWAVAPTLFFAATLLLAGCTSPTSLLGHTASAPTAGATLQLPLASPPSSLDPAQLAGGDTSTLLHAIFSGLMRYNGSGALVTDLAKSYTVTNSGTAYTFELHHSAHFHNGDPVTAQSVLYAINRSCDPHTGVPGIGDYLDVIQGVAERLAGHAQTVSGVQAEGKFTVVFHLTHPDGAFLAKLTMPATFPLDEQTVTHGGNSWWQHPNGTGPYRLVTWDPQKTVVLERYQHFYGPKPAYETVDLLSASAVGNVGQAFTQGRLDLLPLAATPAETAAFFSPSSTAVSNSVRALLHYYDFATLQYLAFNLHAPPFSDIAARRAVDLGIDRSALVTTALGGDGWPASGILPPEIPGAYAQTDPPPANLQLAQQVWRQSRYASQEGTITLESSEILAPGQPGPVTVALANDLHQISNWNVSIVLVSGNTLNQSLQDGSFTGSVALQGWQADYLDPQDFLDLLFRTGKSNNLTHFSDPTVNDLLGQADQAAASQQRLALYRQVETVLLRQLPIVPLYFDREFVLRSPSVQSLPLLPEGGFDLRDAKPAPAH
ncbi:MAG: peptide ABC transporter substrate-binding protein [Chloroflexi bacterium]|nr:peptide ABC transporter substrate-binding protein [Chloroflexota bacterium]